MKIADDNFLGNSECEWVKRLGRVTAFLRKSKMVKKLTISVSAMSPQNTKISTILIFRHSK